MITADGDRTPSQTLARLNNGCGVFEYEVDPAGNTKVRKGKQEGPPKLVSPGWGWGRVPDPIV